MQRLEVSGEVRHIYIYISLGGKGLRWAVMSSVNLEVITLLS
jgi:hypothetical protein